ncbi:hypothetical protein HOF92_14415 [bacterium]|jgi:hypothetical protein|nr:hypothetical protein [bacterium]
MPFRLRNKHIRISLLLVSFFFLHACCNDSEDKPLQPEENQEPPSPDLLDTTSGRRLPMVPPQTSPSLKKKLAKLNLVKLKEPASPQQHFEMKSQIFHLFTKGKYSQNLEKLLHDYWTLSSFEEKRELLAHLISWPSLSRSSMGLKEWRIQEFFRGLETSAVEDILILGFLKNRQGEVQPDIRWYLTRKYKSNLGGNTLLWRQLIEKGKGP